MERDAEIRTPIGQTAWGYYQLWFSKKRRKVHGINAFVESRFYNAFIKFANFTKKVSLPEPETFIWFMIEKQYDPNMWTDNRVYQAYLEFLDRRGDPFTRIASTIQTIKKFTNEAGCEFSDVFDYITTPELIHKIYSRELSPWLLLYSPKFWEFYKNKINPIDRVRIDGVIRLPFWKERIAKYPTIHNEMKTMVKRLNL